MSNNTFYYYYAPTWDCPPEGPIQLGNVIASLKEPGEPLFRGPPPTPSQVIRTSKYAYEHTKKTHKEGGFSILTTFLSLLGVGVDFGVDSKRRHVCPSIAYLRTACPAAIYQLLTRASDEERFFFQRLETTEFVPELDYLQPCIDAPAVQAYLERFLYLKPVYVITGIKTGHGVMATSEASQSRGVTAAVAVDGTIVSGGLVPVGVEPGVEARRETTHATSWEGSDFVFAFRVRRVYAKRKTLAMCEMENYTRGAMLDHSVGELTQSFPELVVESQEEPKPEDEGYDMAVLMEGDEKVLCAIPKPKESKRGP